jgi:hypothetical protein
MGAGDMEEGEKKPDAGTVAGGPERKIVYAVIVVAVVLLAVVLVARFGFNVDLLDPSGGQMSVVKPRLAVSTIGTVISKDQSDVSRPVIATTTPAESCTMMLNGWPAPGLLCSGVCTYVSFDPGNCGGCGVKCAQGQLCNIGACYTPDLMNDPDNCGRLNNRCPTPPNTVVGTCYQGQCSFSTCMPQHRFCGDYTEGCVPMYNDKDHCGSCNKVCSSDQWCNRTYCESGTMPGNCGYLNCPAGKYCSHKDDGTPECVTGAPLGSPTARCGMAPCPAGHCKTSRWGVPYCDNS